MRSLLRRRQRGEAREGDVMMAADTFEDAVLLTVKMAEGAPPRNAGGLWEPRNKSAPEPPHGPQPGRRHLTLGRLTSRAAREQVCVL